MGLTLGVWGGYDRRMAKGRTVVVVGLVLAVVLVVVFGRAFMGDAQGVGPGAVGLGGRGALEGAADVAVRDGVVAGVAEREVVGVEADGVAGDAVADAAAGVAGFVWIELRPVDQDGAPVDMARLGTDAYINAWQEFEPGKWYQYDRGWAVEGTGLSVPSVALGTYRFEVRAGDGFHVVEGGRVGDVFGTAVSELVVLDAGGTREAPAIVELAFRGSGVLRGRVVDAAGAPVGGLSLLAIEAGEPFAGEAGVLPDPRAALIAFEGLGLGAVRGTTDADGRFVFRGLRAGPFVLYRASADGAQALERLAEAPLAADGREHRIALEGGGLLVEVLDADGARLTELEVWNRAGAAGFPPPLGQRVRVWLEQAASASGADFASAAVPSLDGVVTEEGRVRFAGVGAGEYRVMAASRGHGVVVERVRVAAADERVRATLRLAQARAAATLKVHLTDSDGVRLMGLTQVFLTERVSGRRVAGATVDSLMGPSHTTLVAPPGEYWVDVVALPTFDGPGGSVDERGSGAGRAAVTLLPEESATLRFKMPAPARLEVTLGGNLPEQAGGTARIELWRDEESAVGASFYVDAQEDAALAPGRALPTTVQAITWDRAWLSEPLPAGHFRVVAVFADGRRAASTVELFDGRTSSVQLNLD